MVTRIGNSRVNSLCPRILSNARYRLVLVLLLALGLLYTFYPTSRPVLYTFHPPSTINATFLVQERYDKYAVALKTGKEVALKRTPVQLLTFLAPVRNLLLVGEAPGVNVGRLNMVDVYSHLYDYEKDGIIDIISEVLEKRELALLTSSESQIHISVRSLGSSMMAQDFENHLNKREDAEVVPDEESIGWKADAHKNFPGFQELYTQFPNASWYIMIDDDTYLYMEYLDEYLSKFNPLKPYYIGSPTMGCDGVQKWGDGPSFAHGGSGIIISRGAMLKMLPNLKTCIKKYKPCWAGDIRIALCLRDYGILIQESLPWTFNRDPPHNKFDYPVDPCSKPLTFHHLLIEQIQKLYNLESVIPHQINYGELFQDWKDSDEGIIVKGNRKGSDYDSMEADSAKACMERCKQDVKCMSFVFDGETSKCWMKTGHFGSKYRCNK